MPLRLSILALSALFACASITATAQVTPPDPPKAAATADAKKDEKKKPAARKPAPKKADTAKKRDATKAAVAPKKPQEVKLMNTNKPLVLKDKDGNVIPTSPDAYNVDSALPKKR